MTEQNRFADIWDVVSQSPEDATVMKMRADLMSDIRVAIQAKGLNQGQAAELLGLSQPRVSDLLRGKLSKFNLEMLIGLSQLCGHKVEMRISKAA